MAMRMAGNPLVHGSVLMHMAWTDVESPKLGVALRRRRGKRGRVMGGRDRGLRQHQSYRHRKCEDEANCYPDRSSQHR